MQKRLTTNLVAAVLLSLALLTLPVLAQDENEDLRSLYAAELRQKGASPTIPQAVFDELWSEGYTYTEIANAHVLAALLDSQAGLVIRFKPEDLGWADYAHIMLAYKRNRRAMRLLDKSNQVIEAIGENGAKTLVSSKAELLAKAYNMDGTTLTRIKAAGFKDEDILSLVVLAKLRGRNENLAEAVEEAAPKVGWKAELRTVLAMLEKVAGI